MTPQEKAQEFIDRYPVFDLSVPIDLSDVLYLINVVVKDLTNPADKEYWTEVNDCIKQHIATTSEA